MMHKTIRNIKENIDHFYIITVDIFNALLTFSFVQMGQQVKQ